LLGEEELQLDSLSKTFNAGKNSGDSRSISEQLHKKALIEAHAVRQFPQGTCIIECPLVGDSKTIGLPYLHRFAFSKVQVDAFKVSSSNKFQQICDVIRKNQKQQTAIDYSKKLREYTAILERLLPLSGSPGAASGKPLSISGTQLATMLTALGYDLSEFPIDPQGLYPIPATAVKDGKVNLSKAEVLKLLTVSQQLSF
jgi:type IV secretion system protein VirD4